MDQGPLLTEQIDAGARFLAEFQKYTPIGIAFWLKESDGDNWFLHVASDQINGDNFDLAYGEVVRIAQALRDPAFDMFQIKVIGLDSSVATASLGLRRHYPGRRSIRLNGESSGGVEAEEAYINP